MTIGVLLAVFGPLERLWPARPQPWLRPALGTDALFYLGQAVAFSPLAALALAEVHGVVSLGVARDAVRAQPVWLQLVEAVLLGDLCVYWFHRASHASPFLWRFHRVHHTSEHLDWVAAHREHPLDGLLTQLAINGPAMVLGFPLELLAPLAAFRGVWAIYIHSNARLPVGPLRLLLGAPELHHWHHAKHPGRVANFANLAPWCDLVFGTYHRPENDGFELGVPEATPRSWWRLIWEPLVPRRFVAAGGQMARIGSVGCLVALVLSCGSPSSGPGASAPLLLGAQPAPALPDGGPGVAEVTLWVVAKGSDGSLHSPAPESVTVTCPGGCAVARTRAYAGGREGVLAVLVDDSGSNTAAATVCAGCPTDPEKKRVQALQALFSTLLSEAPGWRIGLFDFGLAKMTSVFVSTNHLAGYSSRLDDLNGAAETLTSGGGTTLYDGIADVAPTAAGEGRARFGGDAGVPVRVLVVSDGEDTHSTKKLSDVLAEANRLGVTVDAVGYGARDGGVYPNLAGKAYRDLRTIGLSTGGAVDLVSREALPARFEQLGRAYPSGWLELVVTRPSSARFTGTVSVGGAETTFEVE